jgi:hypothetical protein
VGAFTLAGPAPPGSHTVAGPAFHSSTEELLIADRHRIKGRQVHHAAPPHRAIEVVDARTRTAHSFER